MWVRRGKTEATAPLSRRQRTRVRIAGRNVTFTLMDYFNRGSFSSLKALGLPPQLKRLKE